MSDTYTAIERWKIKSTAESLRQILGALLDAEKYTGSKGNENIAKLEKVAYASDLTDWEDVLRSALQECANLLDSYGIATKDDIYQQISVQAAKLGVTLED